MRWGCICVCWPLLWLFQETEIAVGGRCCRCAPEHRCGQVTVVQSVTSPVYWATTTPHWGKSLTHRTPVLSDLLIITSITFTALNNIDCFFMGDFDLSLNVVDLSCEIRRHIQSDAHYWWLWICASDFQLSSIVRIFLNTTWSQLFDKD